MVDIECIEGGPGLVVYAYKSDYEPYGGEGMEPSFQCGDQDELLSTFTEQGWLQ
jgi:hypothetical protein